MPGASVSLFRHHAERRGRSGRTRADPPICTAISCFVIAASAIPSWMFWTVVMGWHTGRVVFIADDLAARLTGLLADADRQKPTMVVTGTDREWALQWAATAAVRVTATAAGTAGPDGHAIAG
jgi:hypothetical protein